MHVLRSAIFITAVRLHIHSVIWCSMARQPVASWNRGALVDVGLNEGAKISSVSLISVVLEETAFHAWKSLRAIVSAAVDP